MGNNNSPGGREMVRFCMRGHEIRFKEGSIVRNRCPICNSMLDRSRPAMTVEELEQLKAREAAEKEAQAKAAEDPAQQSSEEKPEDIPAPGLQKPGKFPPQVNEGRKLGGRKLGESTPYKRQDDPERASRQDTVPVQNDPRGGSGFYLDLFGDRESIPPEGAWIGREGIGRKWFDGNLMISRKHVYVKPNLQSGRLQVNEDKSLNGVFYSDADGKKIHLDSARMMEPGEILWIYNVPLKIGR